MNQLKKLSKSKSTIIETVTSKKPVSNSSKKLNNPSNVTPLTNSDRSKSMTTLQKIDAKLSRKSLSDEKLKTPSSKTRITPRLSNDKTPVTHFCSTTKRPSSTAKATNGLGGSSFRTPKRFFSDHITAQSTPECFGSVHFETPRTKVENGTDEQTICEGESSNLTVAIRVRPMNIK